MRLSFKKSIVLIILAAILIQVGSQFIYIHKIAENSAQRLLSYTNTTVKQIENNLDSAFKSIAYTTTYFPSIPECSSSWRRRSSWKNTGC